MASCRSLELSDPDSGPASIGETPEGPLGAFGAIVRRRGWLVSGCARARARGADCNPDGDCRRLQTDSRGLALGTFPSILLYASQSNLQDGG